MTKASSVAERHPNQAIVQWKGESVAINFQDVKNLICPLATDQEAAIFIRTCQSLQLNPFAGECHLIKYDAREKAAFVIAIDAYLKAAEANNEYDGCEAGIILRGDSGKLELRAGAFLLDEERAGLVGGWAKVYRKDRSRPTYVAVNKTECVKLTREGKPTQFWAETKQPWMLRKSALKRALVEAFPSLFAGTLATSEVAPEREYPLEEGQVPPAFQNGDGPAWDRFWVRVRDELGLDREDVHKILGVESVKQLLDEGLTMEQVWHVLVDKICESHVEGKAMAYETGEMQAPPQEGGNGEEDIDMDWLRDSLNTLQWANVPKYLKAHYPEAGDTTLRSVRQMIASLTPEHRQDFITEVQARLKEQEQWT